MSATPDNLETLLQSRFGLGSFRKGQREIIESVVAGRDAMAVMPTGGGKSLCYQLPAVVKEGIVVVISPLIALMNDQVRSLGNLGIAAGCLHSGQTYDEKAETFARMKENKSFVLYLSPERVQKEGFATWIKSKNISLFAVDESHCVSQWGPDFRKDYHRLELLRELKPGVPILALTATATPPVLADIIRQLKLKEPDRHIHGFYRPNLYYQVESCDNDGVRLNYVEQALKQTPEGRILIYCGTRKQTEEVVNQLVGDFPQMGYYHAGLGAEERTRIQKDYETGKIRILAATNAFGMGIDHPDVRLVVHFQMPANIESLYQEMGRAGRDGNPSTCLLLYSRKDKGLHAHFITQANLEKSYANSRWRALETIVQFAEGGECRHAGVLTYFKDSTRMKQCGHCDICDPDSNRKVQPPAYKASVSTKKSRSKKKTASVAKDEKPLSATEELRADVLRTWRKEYAEANDIPAFLVFSNKTLSELARKNPRTSDQLLAVYGMGPQKVEHLGALILSQLASCS